jgi:GDP-L-fucose synthase
VEAWFSKNQPSVVVLAAAKVGGIQANSGYQADFLLENLKIQTHVIETAWRSGVRRLFFLGSSCIDPKFAEQPIREEALRIQHGFDAISLMPTNLYGPGDNYHPTNRHVLPATIHRFHEAAEANAPSVTCWGTGSPLHEFLHVDDLGDACVFALEHWSPTPGELTYLDVGTGVALRIRDLADAVATATGDQDAIHWDPTKPDGTPKKQLEVSLLATLGWRARIPLDVVS